jgi:hypothetical protein
MRLTPPSGIMPMVPTSRRRTRVGKVEEEATVSSAEETNKDLVRRFFEALTQRDLDALEEMMVPDFVNHTKLLPGQEAPDREGYLGREG